MGAMKIGFYLGAMILLAAVCWTAMAQGASTILIGAIGSVLFIAAIALMSWLNPDHHHHSGGHGPRWGADRKRLI